MWRTEYAAEAERDFEQILDHLFASYVGLGEAPEEALDHAAERVLGLRAAIDRLATAPFVGTSRPDIRAGLRYIRRDGAAVWFIPSEEMERVRVLAVFFGAQDHVRHMLVRMLS